MEIVDELMTPGCPNCAVKHLSAALATMVAMRIPKIDVGATPAYGDEINVARALVNLVEVYEGYASHFDYAVGLLVKAEECTVVNDLRDIATAVREIRVKLMVAGPAGIPEAVKDLGSLVEGGAVACGHLLEALRELPELPPLKDTYTVDDLRGMIASVVADYFTVEEPEKKGGE